MAGASRDRVTIDLRGIGDAVRMAARHRQLTVAALARDALLRSVDPPTSGVALATARVTEEPDIAKLTLRMRTADAKLLTNNANSLGLSYGAYVARLVRGHPLPLPSATREADRAALLRHCDHLAQWAIDAHSLARLLRAGHFDPALIGTATGEAMTVDVRQHLDIASRLLAQPLAHLEVTDDRPETDRRHSG
jgi:hypothetical protein